MAIDKIIVEFQAETTKLKKELDDLKSRLGNVETKAQQGGKNITKSFDNAGTGVNKLSANLKNLAGTLGLAFGAQEVIRFTKQTIDAASDLNETVSKSQQIFGTASKSVEQFASNSAKQFGMSKKTAIDAAASFGTFGKAAGLTGEDLGTFSTDLVALSADLASFGNTTPEEAAMALGAALRGEAEPIRKFGVLLDEATLKQEALAMGIITNTKSALTPQQKVLAANAVILKQTSDAQGDFARTSGGAANQQRIMSATLEDVQAKLGEKLLPAFQQGIQTLNEFVANADWDAIFGGLEEVINNVAEPWGEFFDAIGDVYRALTAGLSTGEKTAGIFDAIKVSVNLGLIPIKLLSKWLRLVVDNGIIPLINAGKNVIAWFNEVRESGGFVGAIFNGIASAAGAVVDKLVGVAQFIGLVDSEEEKAAKNAKKREEERLSYAKRIEQQTIKRSAQEERLMALKAKTAYLGQKLTKEEEAELKKLTAATNQNTKASDDNSKEKEKAKTALEKLNEELAKLETAQENATFEGNIDKAKQYQEAISKLENQLAIFKSTLESIRGGVVSDADLENIDKASDLSFEYLDNLAKGFGLLDNARPDFTTDEDGPDIQPIISGQEKAQEKVRQTQELFNNIANSVTSVTGPAFAAINALYDANLQRLEKEKNQRLANENLTAEERLRIEEEYEKKKNEMMAEQFEVNRVSQIIQATMSAAQAALNAFTSTALLFAPAAPAAAAAAGAFGALQIGIIAAQPNPYKFFEGTPYLQLGGNPKGKDTIPVMAHEGEAIIPTGKNLQYPGLAKSWIDGSLDGYINKNFVRPALMEQQRQAEEDFADRLAASMALQMSSNFDDYRLFRATKEQTAVLRDGFQTMKQTRKKLRGA
jgi:hypothetical protein